MNSPTIQKTYVYWPDGSLKEIPPSGTASTNMSGCYVWDSNRHTWIDSSTGNRAYFGGQYSIASHILWDSLDEFADFSADELRKQMKEAIKCQCGAAHTANPNLHSNWCPCA